MFDDLYLNFENDPICNMLAEYKNEDCVDEEIIMKHHIVVYIGNHLTRTEHATFGAWWQYKHGRLVPYSMTEMEVDIVNGDQATARLATESELKEILAQKNS